MQKAKFDPGFAPLVEHFSQNTDIFSQVISSIKPIHQKKFKYKVMFPKLINLMKNNVAFYYGCLVWAFSLVNEYKDSPLEIEGNSFLELTETEISQYDFLEEINFIINYVNIIEKDSRYYLGKSASIPEFWIIVLNFYKEFLELNNGFVRVGKTSDIKLPKAFETIKYNNELKELVLNVIDKQSIENLLDTNIFS